MALAAKARNGDTGAFEKLVDRFKGPLCATIYPIVRDWHVTQDIAQETFAVAYQRLDDLRECRRFQAWLHRIARNRAVSLRRWGRRIRTQSLSRLSDEELHEHSRSSKHRESEWAWRSQPSDKALQRVRRVILSLPNGYGSVLVMHHVDGLNLSEIAEVLGRTRKAVKALLYRARIQARDYLKKAGLDYERVFHEL